MSEATETQTTQITMDTHHTETVTPDTSTTRIIRASD